MSKKIKDTLLNRAEIYASMECGRLFFRPANELKAATEKVVKEAFIQGYDTASLGEVEPLLEDKDVTYYQIAVDTHIKVSENADGDADAEYVAGTLHDILHDKI